MDSTNSSPRANSRIECSSRSVIVTENDIEEVSLQYEQQIELYTEECPSFSVSSSSSVSVIWNTRKEKPGKVTVPSYDEEIPAFVPHNLSRPDTPPHEDTPVDETELKCGLQDLPESPTSNRDGIYKTVSPNHTQEDVAGPAYVFASVIKSVKQLGSQPQHVLHSEDVFELASQPHEDIQESVLEDAFEIGNGVFDTAGESVPDSNGTTIEDQHDSRMEETMSSTGEESPDPVLLSTKKTIHYYKKNVFNLRKPQHKQDLTNLSTEATTKIETTESGPGPPTLHEEMTVSDSNDFSPPLISSLQISLEHTFDFDTVHSTEKEQPKQRETTESMKEDITRQIRSPHKDSIDSDIDYITSKVPSLQKVTTESDSVDIAEIEPLPQGETLDFNTKDITETALLQQRESTDNICPIQSTQKDGINYGTEEIAKSIPSLQIAIFESEIEVINGAIQLTQEYTLDFDTEDIIEPTQIQMQKTIDSDEQHVAGKAPSAQYEPNEPDTQDVLEPVLFLEEETSGAYSEDTSGPGFFLTEETTFSGPIYLSQEETSNSDTEYITELSISLQTETTVSTTDDLTGTIRSLQKYDIGYDNEKMSESQSSSQQETIEQDEVDITGEMQLPQKSMFHFGREYIIELDELPQIQPTDFEKETTDSHIETIDENIAYEREDLTEQVFSPQRETTDSKIVPISRPIQLLQKKNIDNDTEEITKYVSSPHIKNIDPKDEDTTVAIQSPQKYIIDFDTEDITTPVQLPRIETTEFITEERNRPLSLQQNEKNDSNTEDIAGKVPFGQKMSTAPDVEAISELVPFPKEETNGFDIEDTTDFGLFPLPEKETVDFDVEVITAPALQDKFGLVSSSQGNTEDISEPVLPLKQETSSFKIEDVSEQIQSSQKEDVDYDNEEITGCVSVQQQETIEPEIGPKTAGIHSESATSDSNIDSPRQTQSPEKEDIDRHIEEITECVSATEMKIMGSEKEDITGAIDLQEKGTSESDIEDRTGKLTSPRKETTEADLDDMSRKVPLHQKETSGVYFDGIFGSCSPPEQISNSGPFHITQEETFDFGIENLTETMILPERVGKVTSQRKESAAPDEDMSEHVPKPQDEVINFDTEDITDIVSSAQRETTDSQMENGTRQVLSPQKETINSDTDDIVGKVISPQKESPAPDKHMPGYLLKPNVEDNNFETEVVTEIVSVSPQTEIIKPHADDIAGLFPLQKIEASVSQIEDRIGPVLSLQKEIVDSVTEDIVGNVLSPQKEDIHDDQEEITESVSSSQTEPPESDADCISGEFLLQQSETSVSQMEDRIRTILSPQKETIDADTEDKVISQQKQNDAPDEDMCEHVPKTEGEANDFETEDVTDTVSSAQRETTDSKMEDIIRLVLSPQTESHAPNEEETYGQFSKPQDEVNDFEIGVSHIVLSTQRQTTKSQIENITGPIQSPQKEDIHDDELTESVSLPQIETIEHEIEAITAGFQLPKVDTPDFDTEDITQPGHVQQIETTVSKNVDKTTPLLSPQKETVKHDDENVTEQVPEPQCEANEIAPESVTEPEPLPQKETTDFKSEDVTGPSKSPQKKDIHCDEEITESVSLEQIDTIEAITRGLQLPQMYTLDFDTEGITQLGHVQQVETTVSKNVDRTTPLLSSQKETAAPDEDVSEQVSEPQCKASENAKAVTEAEPVPQKETTDSKSEVTEPIQSPPREDIHDDEEITESVSLPQLEKIEPGIDPITGRLPSTKMYPLDFDTEDIIQPGHGQQLQTPDSKNVHRTTTLLSPQKETGASYEDDTSEQVPMQQGKVNDFDTEHVTEPVSSPRREIQSPLKEGIDYEEEEIREFVSSPKTETIDRDTDEILGLVPLPRLKNSDSEMEYGIRPVSPLKKESDSDTEDMVGRVTSPLKEITAPDEDISGQGFKQQGEVADFDTEGVTELVSSPPRESIDPEIKDITGPIQLQQKEDNDIYNEITESVSSLQTETIEPEIEVPAGEFQSSLKYNLDFDSDDIAQSGHVPSIGITESKNDDKTTLLSPQQDNAAPDEDLTEQVPKPQHQINDSATEALTAPVSSLLRETSDSNIEAIAGLIQSPQQEVDYDEKEVRELVPSLQTETDSPDTDEVFGLFPLPELKNSDSEMEDSIRPVTPLKKESNSDTEEMVEKVISPQKDSIAPDEEQVPEPQGDINDFDSESVTETLSLSPQRETTDSEVEDILEQIHPPQKEDIDYVKEEITEILSSPQITIEPDADDISGLVPLQQTMDSTMENKLRAVLSTQKEILHSDTNDIVGKVTYPQEDTNDNSSGQVPKQQGEATDFDTEDAAEFVSSPLREAIDSKIQDRTGPTLLPQSEDTDGNKEITESVSSLQTKSIQPEIDITTGGFQLSRKYTLDLDSKDITQPGHVPQIETTNFNIDDRTAPLVSQQNDDALPDEDLTEVLKPQDEANEIDAEDVTKVVLSPQRQTTDFTIVCISGPNQSPQKENIESDIEPTPVKETTALDAQHLSGQILLPKVETVDFVIQDNNEPPLQQESTDSKIDDNTPPNPSPKKEDITNEKEEIKKSVSPQYYTFDTEDINKTIQIPHIETTDFEIINRTGQVSPPQKENTDSDREDTTVSVLSPQKETTAPESGLSSSVPQGENIDFVTEDTSEPVLSPQGKSTNSMFEDIIWPIPSSQKEEVYCETKELITASMSSPQMETTQPGMEFRTQEIPCHQEYALDFDAKEITEKAGALQRQTTDSNIKNRTQKVTSPQRETSDSDSEDRVVIVRSPQKETSTPETEETCGIFPFPQGEIIDLVSEDVSQPQLPQQRETNDFNIEDVTIPIQSPGKEDIDYEIAEISAPMGPSQMELIEPSLDAGVLSRLILLPSGETTDIVIEDIIEPATSQIRETTDSKSEDKTQPNLSLQKEDITYGKEELTELVSSQIEWKHEMEDKTGGIQLPQEYIFDEEDISETGKFPQIETSESKIKYSTRKVTSLQNETIDSGTEDIAGFMLSHQKEKTAIEVEEIRGLLTLPQDETIDFFTEDISEHVLSPQSETTSFKVESITAQIQSPQKNDNEYDTKEMTKSVSSPQMEATETGMEVRIEEIPSPQGDAFYFETEENEVLQSPERQTTDSKIEEVTGAIQLPQQEDIHYDEEEIREFLSSPQKETVDPDTDDIFGLVPLPQLKNSDFEMEDRITPVPPLKKESDSDNEDMFGNNDLVRQRIAEKVLSPEKETTTSDAEDLSGQVVLPQRETIDYVIEDIIEPALSPLREIEQEMEDKTGAIQLPQEYTLDIEDISEPVKLAQITTTDSEITKDIAGIELSIQKETTGIEAEEICGLVPLTQVETMDFLLGEVSEHVLLPQRERTTSKIEDTTGNIQSPQKDDIDSGKEEIPESLSSPQMETIEPGIEGRTKEILSPQEYAFDFDTEESEILLPGRQTTDSKIEEITGEIRLPQKDNTDNDTQGIPGKVLSPEKETTAIDADNLNFVIEDITEPALSPLREIEQEMEDKTGLPQEYTFDTDDISDTFMETTNFKIKDRTGQLPSLQKEKSDSDTEERAGILLSTQKETTVFEADEICGRVPLAQVESIDFFLGEVSEHVLSTQRDTTDSKIEDATVRIQSPEIENIYYNLEEITESVSSPQKETTEPGIEGRAKEILSSHEFLYYFDEEDFTEAGVSQQRQTTDDIGNDKEAIAKGLSSPKMETIQPGMQSRTEEILPFEEYAFEFETEEEEVFRSPKRQTTHSSPDVEDTSGFCPSPQKRSNGFYMEGISGPPSLSKEETTKYEEEISESRSSSCQEPSVSDIECQPVPLLLPQKNMLPGLVYERQSNEGILFGSAHSRVKRVIPDTEDVCGITEVIVSDEEDLFETMLAHNKSSVLDGVSVEEPSTLPPKQHEGIDKPDIEGQFTFVPSSLVKTSLCHTASLPASGPEDSIPSQLPTKESTVSDTKYLSKSVPNVDETFEPDTLQRKGIVTQIEGSSGSLLAQNACVHHDLDSYGLVPHPQQCISDSDIKPILVSGSSLCQHKTVSNIAESDLLPTILKEPNVSVDKLSEPLPSQVEDIATSKKEVPCNNFSIAPNETYVPETEDKHLHPQQQKVSSAMHCDNISEMSSDYECGSGQMRSIYKGIFESESEDAAGPVSFLPHKLIKTSDTRSVKSSPSSKGDFSESMKSSFQETTSDGEDFFRPVGLPDGASPIFHVARPATKPPPREERRRRRRGFCLRVPDQKEIKLSLKSTPPDTESFPSKDHPVLCDDLLKAESKESRSAGQPDQVQTPILPKASTQKQLRGKISKNVSSTSTTSDHLHHQSKRYQGRRKNEASPKVDIKHSSRAKRGNFVDQHIASSTAITSTTLTSSTVIPSKSSKECNSKKTSSFSKARTNTHALTSSSPLTPSHEKTSVSHLPQPQQAQGSLQGGRTVRRAFTFGIPNQKKAQISPYAVSSVIAKLPRVRKAPSQTPKSVYAYKEFTEKKRKEPPVSKIVHQHGPLPPPPKENCTADSIQPGKNPPTHQERKKTTRPSFKIRVPDSQPTAVPPGLAKADVCGERMNEQRKGSKSMELPQPELSPVLDKTLQKQVKENKTPLKSLNFPPISDSYQRKRSCTESWNSDTKISEEKPVLEIRPLSPYRSRRSTPVSPTVESRSLEMKKELKPEIVSSSSFGQEQIVSQDSSPRKVSKFSSLSDKRKEPVFNCEKRGHYKPKGGMIIDRELEPLRPKTDSRRNMIGSGSAIRATYRPKAGPIAGQDIIPMRSTAQSGSGTIQKGLGLGSIRCAPDNLRQETSFDPLRFKSECRRLEMKQNDPVSTIQPYRQREAMLFDNTLPLRTEPISRRNRTTNSGKPTHSTPNGNASMSESKKIIQMVNVSLAASTVMCSQCGYGASLFQCRRDMMLGCQMQVPRPPNCGDTAVSLLKKIATYPPQRLMTCKSGLVETDTFKQLKYTPARTV